MLIVWGSFSNLKNQNFEKMKNEKNTWRYYHFTYVYQKWQSYDVWFLRYWVRLMEFFCYLGPFFALLPPKQTEKSKFWKKEKTTWRYYHFKQLYHKRQSYGVWFLTYEAWRTEFFVILDHYPSNNTKNQNFEKLKKMPGDIIILHKCTTNHDHMLYCSLDKVRNGCHFCFLLWAIFCPFDSLTSEKPKLEI